MADTILHSRNKDDSGINPDNYGRPLVRGEIALVAWVSAANPTAEVLDQATAQLVTVQAKGVTIDLTAGTITVLRDGIYELELTLAKVSSASASGVMDFTIQKNSASLSPSVTLGLLQPAVAANFMSATTGRANVLLAAGDVIRCVVTGTVGGVITVAAGRFSVEMKSDAANPSKV